MTTPPQAATGPRAVRLRQLLLEAFPGATLTLYDDSARHAGHVGITALGANSADGETHFRLHLRHPIFKGLSHVAAHQRVYAVVATEFQQGLHSLQLNIAAE